MISVTTLLTFIAASAFLAFVPGPSMALLISNSTTKGTRAGLVALAGNSLGLTSLVAAAILGMAPLLSLASQWFDVIRIVGALYLVWMGINYIRTGLKAGDEQQAANVKLHHIFGQAVAVSLSNPKVLLFLGAFFPQFVDPALAMTPQLVALGISFLVTVLTIDAAIVLTSGYARRWLLEKQKATHIASGTLLIGAGVGLAFAHR